MARERRSGDGKLPSPGPGDFNDHSREIKKEAPAGKHLFFVFYTREKSWPVQVIRWK
jgi:hypothetical protein